MPRTATPLNIKSQPGIGMGYVIKHIASRKLVRCSTTCQRDIEREGSKVKQLRAFSGDHPFFTAKIGSVHVGIQVLKFLCGKGDGRKCVDSKGEYEWLGVSLKEARKEGMKFSEPNYVAAAEEAPAKKSTKKSKKAEKAVTKPAKKTKTVKARKTRTKKEAPAAPTLVDGNVTDVSAVTTTETTTAPAAEETTTAPAAPVQTDAEFQAEIDADFEADAARALAAASAQ